MKLNGWQRLWIVLSLIWYCLIALVIIMGTRPQSLPIYTQWAAKTKEIIDKTPTARERLWAQQQRKAGSNSKVVSGLAPEVLAALGMIYSSPYAKMAATQASIHSAQDRFIAYLRASPKRLPLSGPATTQFQKLNVDFKSRLQNLRIERRREIVRAVEVALIPSIVLYVFGFGVAWVRRGFKTAPN